MRLIVELNMVGTNIAYSYGNCESKQVFWFLSLRISSKRSRFQDFEFIGLEFDILWESGVMNSGHWANKFVDDGFQDLVFVIIRFVLTDCKPTNK